MVARAVKEVWPCAKEKLHFAIKPILSQHFGLLPTYNYDIVGEMDGEEEEDEEWPCFRVAEQRAGALLGAMGACSCLLLRGRGFLHIKNIA